MDHPVGDPTAVNADNILSSPYTAGDPNAGDWRMIAEVLTGQGISIPASQGPTVTTTAGTGTTPGGGEPTTGGGTTGGTGTTTTPGPDIGTVTQVSHINSLYLVPGLPEKDMDGNKIDYGVYLANQLRTGAANTFYSNPFQRDFIAAQGTGATLYTYPNEFYGGVDVPLSFGRADATIVNNAADDLFMSNYIIGEMDNDGRIAASINSGPTLLSGYNMGPQSYVVLTCKGLPYTNKTGPIAPVIEPVVVKDSPPPAQIGIPSDSGAQAAGAWLQAGKFKMRSAMRLSSAAGPVGLPSSIEVIHTITNLSDSASTFTLRQVLDTNIFGRENPVYMIDNQYVDRSMSLTGAQIPREVFFQSWATTETAIRAFLAPTGGLNTTPDWITIGTLPELNRIFGSTGGISLRSPASINLDSGMALGWNFTLGVGEQKVIRYTFGYYPGGKVFDSWVTYPNPLPAGTVLSGFEDDPNKIRPVNVIPGKVIDGVDIFTNKATTAPSGITTQVPEGSATGILQFIRLANGFPNYTNEFVTGGAVGDLDNDGYLDIVTCARNGNNPGSAMNRIYLNTQQINSDGSVTRYFRDVTLGDDVNDPSTYRLQPLHQGENTFGVVLADFDDDGWLEILFTNRGAPIRYYDNLGPDKPGYFVEDTNAVPGPINTDWATVFDAPYRAVAGDIDCDGDLDLIISEWAPFFTSDPRGQGYDPMGWFDIDNPTPWNGNVGDGRMSFSRDRFTSTFMYSERVLINYKYTPQYARHFNDIHQRVNPATGESHSIRQEHASDQMGTYFVDETLGSDDRPGTLTSLVTQHSAPPVVYQRVVSWDPTEIDRMPPAFPNTWTYTEPPGFAPSGLTTSRMGTSAVEPRLGPLFGGSGLDLMSVRAGGGGSAGSIVVPFTVASTTGGDYDWVGVRSQVAPAGIAFGTDAAFFRNCDMFSNYDDGSDNGGTAAPPIEVHGDGIPDGYFACMNYNMDYNNNVSFNVVGQVYQPMVSASGYAQSPGGNGGIRTTRGLFMYENDVDTSAGVPFLHYDAFPLLTGIPEAFTNEKGDSTATDIVTPPASPGTGRPAWAGLIGDWENMGYPLPLIAADNSALGGSAPFRYVVPNTTNYGVSRKIGNGINQAVGGTTLIGGWATQYFEIPNWPYTPGLEGWGAPFNIDGSADSTNPTIATGQPYGAASADFDMDGDEDLFIVNSSLDGLDNGNGGFNSKAYKQAFTNDSFGVFTEAAGALVPNEPVNGVYCAVGDLDNDGDPDLLSFNMLGPNEAYINQAFTKPADLLSDKDSTLFYEATHRFIPNISGNGYVSNPTDNGPNSGITLRATVSDLNGDGRPDLLLAEGGQFSTVGDYCRVLLNMGKPVGDGVPVFKPAGAPYPGPRADLWIHNLISLAGTYTVGAYGEKIWAQNQRASGMLEGYMGGPYSGFINDVIAGDVNNDGSPDVLIVRSGGGTDLGGTHISSGPQLLLNSDSDLPILNSHPDSDSLGDAVFYDGNLVRLTDPGQSPLSGMPIFKNQGQAAVMADFNEDGLLDIIIGNGYPDDPQGRGAPNVLLLNSKDLPGNFTDVTETNLPTSITTGGIVKGVYDNTLQVAVGDFNSDGHVDVLFANDAQSNAPLGFRMMLGDGAGHLTDTPQGELIPTFIGRHVKGIKVADIDGLGEPTEDKNFNGHLDQGEDTNGNGRIDWTDLPTETEDLNGNGVLDPGEDGLIGPPNGKIDTYDYNNDGVLTARRPGVWDGSLDIVVTFDNDIPALLINDPTNQHPGVFRDEALTRLSGVIPGPNRGLDIGDVNLDGYPDIAIAQYVGGLVRPVQLWLNQPKTDNGHVRWGFFKDISYEVPLPRGIVAQDEVLRGTVGPDDSAADGWAYDVKFLDVHGDGDLDMFVACAASKNRILMKGAQDYLYMNRTIGAGFNFKGYAAAQAGKGNPNVFSIWPRGAKRDSTLTVVVTGENLQPSTLMSFGDGVTVTSKHLLDKTSMSVGLTVAPDASLGPRAVLVQNPSGSAAASKVGLFNVYELAPNEVPNRSWALYE